VSIEIGIKLLEAFGKAVGYLGGGKHAEAVAKAQIIGNAKGTIEAIELFRNAGYDFLAERAMQQATITDVANVAATLINDGADPELASPDWIRNFYDKCRLTSDEEMKILWAKVLAGEVNSPGAFSKRTVNLVGELEKEDAQNFTKMASFVLLEREPFLFITNYNLPFFKRAGITHASLLKLQDAGLLDSETFGGYSIQDAPSELIFRYFENAVKLKRIAGRRDVFFVPSVFMLTTSGKQLYPVCGPEKNPQFLQYLVDHYNLVSSQGWTAEILL
jgi:Protein of unknown function (DUF2806)